jgi:hypothetical protein
MLITRLRVVTVRTVRDLLVRWQVQCPTAALPRGMVPMKHQFISANCITVTLNSGQIETVRAK